MYSRGRGFRSWQISSYKQRKLYTCVYLRVNLLLCLLLEIHNPHDGDEKPTRHIGIETRAR